MILDTRTPGFDFKRKWRITVDGVELRKVFYADDEQGFVKCVALNAEGNPYPDPRRPEGHAVVEHRGVVVIEELPR